MTDFTFQVTDFVFQGDGEFVFQGSTDAAPSNVIRNFSLREWRQWRRPQDEEYLKQKGVESDAAKVIAEVAERQAEDLHLDEQQRLEELTRELYLKGVEFEGRHLELLNIQRQRLIDGEIAHLLAQKQANLQSREQESILLFLLTL